MGFITWIAAGALLGGAAGALTGIGDRRGFCLNIATGIAGVMLGGWFLGKLIGASAFDPGAFSLGSLLVSLLAAAALLACLHEVRRFLLHTESTSMNVIPGIRRAVRSPITAGVAGILMLVGACASTPPAPQSALDAARGAISNAGESR